MIQSIHTKYKKLDLQLNDLGQVNYFVGKNGSGKTLLMSFISNYIKTLQENKPEFNNFLKENISVVIDNTKEQGYLHAYQPFDFEFTNQNSTGSGSHINEYVFTHKLVSLFFGDDATFISTPYCGIKQGDTILGLKETPAGFQSLMNIWLTVFINYPYKKTPIFWFATIDEIDRHLHPKMAKKLPSLLNEMIETMKEHILKTQGVKSNFQFFLTSHSPFLIRAALEEVNHKIYHLDNCKLKNRLDKTELTQSKGLSFDQVIGDLGFEMKDIYYPNCLIYVEGPVEVLYITYWLEKYFESKGKFKNHFVKGIDYDFVEFGGALAAHLSLKFNSQTENNDVLDKTELVNIFSLNRKVFVMVDNDTNQNSFEKTKQRLKEVLDKIDSCKFYRNENYRTIECLLTQESNISKNKNNKLEAAIVNLKNWRENNFGLDKFNPETIKLCDAVFKFIGGHN